MTESDFSIRHLARCSIELETAMHVGSGESGGSTDAQVVRDAHGYPAIPGSSLAGILRALLLEQLEKILGEGAALIIDELFGYQRTRAESGAGDDPVEGRGSRITISWACIHGADNIPVDGTVEAMRERSANDPVLNAAVALPIRDHVRMNHRRTADRENNGKFDEEVVQAGHRFTFEIELISDGSTSDDQAWQLLLNAIQHGGFRIGGRTLRGIGRFKCIQLLKRRFHLENSDDWNAYLEHPALLGESPVSFEDHKPNDPAIKRINIPLRPEGGWMIAGGDDPEGADQAPVTEERIVWDGEVRVQSCWLTPGSAIKGPLAHRTAFHFNRLQGTFADKSTAAEFEEASTRNPATRELFGFVDQPSPEAGKKKPVEVQQRGRIGIDDWLTPMNEEDQQLLFNHVTIDRFTNATLGSTLFNERPHWQDEGFVLQLTLPPAANLKPEFRAAFGWAIRDLLEGRLALGGASSRGLGFFTGDEPVVLTAWSGIPPSNTRPQPEVQP